MKVRLVVVTVLIGLSGLIVLLAAGCGPQPLPEEPTPIPTLVPATPIKEEPGDLAKEGVQVFTQNCSTCHNITAEPKIGPGLAGLFDLDSLPNGNAVTDANLREWITNGGGAMPGISLSDADLDALIAYLKEGTKVMGTVPTPGEPTAEQGTEVFRGNCASCHNVTAEAKVGPGLAGLFDLASLPNGNPVTEENLGDWITNGGGNMPAISLSEEDLAAVILYLKEATVVEEEAAAPTEPPAPAPSEEGEQVFQTNCAGCHNLTAETKVGPGLAGLFDPTEDLPNDKPFSEENLRDWISTGGGGMPAFSLSDEDMTTLIDYLREATKED